MTQFMSSTVDAAAELEPPETVDVLDQSGENVVERVRLMAVDEVESIGYGVTIDDGQQVTLRSLEQLIEQDRLDIN